MGCPCPRARGEGSAKAEALWMHSRAALVTERFFTIDLLPEFVSEAAKKCRSFAIRCDFSVSLNTFLLVEDKNKCCFSYGLVAFSAHSLPETRVG